MTFSSPLGLATQLGVALLAAGKKYSSEFLCKSQLFMLHWDFPQHTVTAPDNTPNTPTLC